MSISLEFQKEMSLEIIYKGQKINRCFNLYKKGKYKLKFTFIKTNSQFIQAIKIFLDDFKGNLIFNGNKIIIPKKKFPQLNFFEDTAPKEFIVEVDLEDGHLSICNGSDPLGTKQFCHSLVFGCAMIIEHFEHNKYRFICNDHEDDEDFDDLIFEMEIIE